MRERERELKPFIYLTIREESVCARVSTCEFLDVNIQKMKRIYSSKMFA